MGTVLFLEVKKKKKAHGPFFSFLDGKDEILGKVITSMRRSAVTLNSLYSIEVYFSTSEN